MKFIGNWARYPGNPILALGSKDSFDSFNIAFPMVVKDEGLYKMWYSGGYKKGCTKYRRIGYATSKDGLHWVKYSKNSVLKLEEKDNFHCSTPTILRRADGYLLKEEGLYKIWFIRQNEENYLEYATSPDGIHWKRYSENPLLKGIYSPTIIKDGKLYKMWYAENAPNFQIGYATSEDGIHWKTYTDNPVMRSIGAWEGKGNLYPFVIKEGKEFFMWYTIVEYAVTGKGNTRIGLARSPDGIHWTKLKQPVLQPDPESKWDSIYTSCPCVIKEADTYRLYYAGRKDMVHKYYAIGLAESPLFKGVQVYSDFETGNGKNIHQISKYHFSLEVEGDFDCYSDYFCFEIKNWEKKKAKIQVEVKSPDRTDKIFTKSWDKSFRNSVLWERWKGEWIKFSRERIEIDSEKLRITEEVESGEAVRFSYQISLLYSFFLLWLKRVAQLHQEYSQLRVIGESIEKRDICLISITDPKVEALSKRRVLILSGYHAVEPGTWGSCGIVEYLLGESEEIKKLRENYIFDIIPQANPDGSVGGRCGSNARMVNLYHSFTDEALVKGKKLLPEAICVWNWIEKYPPFIYLELHGYSEGDKDHRPYFLPISSWSSKKMQKRIEAINRTLLSLSQGRYINDSSKETLAYRLATQFNTIAYLYEPHMRYGIEGNKKLAVKVLKTILKVSAKDL